MARNGSGTFTPSVDFTTEAASPPIEIAKLDTAITDIGGEITNSIAADGQTNPTADLPMNGFNHTGVDNAAARDQYASAADVQDQDLTYFVDSGAADAYVITPSPSIGAYEEGQRLVFRATNTNTGASTLNVNALGARAIQTPDGQALDAGAIVDGGIYEVTYDANTTPDRWVLTSPPSAIPDSMLSSNVPLLDASTNIFKGLRSTDGSPVLFFEETDASADNGNWRIAVLSEDFRIQMLNDAQDTVVNAIAIQRTGTTVDEIQLDATLLDFNGNMDVSGTLDVGGNATISNTAPILVLEDTNAAADEGRFRFISNGGLFQIGLENDAGVAASPSAFSVFRTGTVIDEIQLDATLLDFNGNVDISGSLVLGAALAVAEGGTGATTVSAARENLGVQTKALTSTQGTTSGTAEDITGLTGFPLDASSVYMIEGFAITEGTDASTGMDLHTGYSGTISNGEWMFANNTATDFNGISATLAMDINNTGNSSNLIRGSIHTSTAGNLDFRFSRSAGIGTANLKPGTVFKVTKVV